MKTLNRYCQKNVVAGEWLNDYNRTKDLINKILKDKHVDEDIFLDYEDLVLDMDSFFEHIKTNPGFEDWFIEFVENQLCLLNGMHGFYLKHYDTEKNDSFISLFEELNKVLLEDERNLLHDI